MAFFRTTAINKLLAMTARKKVVQGSTYAGKTYGIIPILINEAASRPKLKITVVAETLPAVKEGALDIFKIIMDETERWIELNWNASSLTYTFVNGSRIQFKSFDTVGKAKAAGKRDILFLNEGNHIAFDIADTLMVRSEEVWIDFNPDAPFWAHTEVLKEPNSELLVLTYLDNEKVPKTALEDLNTKMAKAFFDVGGDWDDVANIKSSYWANWCRVYVRGLVGTLEGTIFRDFEVVERVPPGAEFLGYGTDFGKGGPDPTTTTAFYYFDGVIIWDELVYQSDLRDSDHAKQIKAAGLDLSASNFCDASEPSKTKELRIYGVTGSKTMKKETIEYGIGLIQEKPFVVTARSKHILEELSKYKRNSEGVPIDAYNHTIDGARYFYVGKFGVNAKAKLRYKRG